MDQAAREKFEEVALPHMDSVYRMARRLARQGAEVDDLVQETYVQACRSFATFELREFGAKPWLLRILYNVFCATVRKRRRGPLFVEQVTLENMVEDLDQAQTEPTTIDNINWDGMDEELKYAVDQLAPDHRVILLLWALEGLRYREIAEICDCPIGTVMARLYRARQTIWRYLRAYARDRRIDTKRFER